MNLYVKSEAPSLLLEKGTEPKPAYIAGIVGVLFLWAAFSAVTALVVVAILVPGHLGLTDWLKVLSHVWPTESPVFTT